MDIKKRLPSEFNDSMDESSTQFNKYDILLLASKDNEKVRFAPGNYPGNERFRVLLEIYRQKYMEAYLLGEYLRCELIAQEVLTTVCDQCNGRIFELNHGNTWGKLDSSHAIAVTKKTLKSEPIDRLYSSSFKRKRSAETHAQEAMYIESPEPYDVICDIKSGCVVLEGGNAYVGNNRLKILVDIRKKRYTKSSQEAKKQLVSELVRSILVDASGRFLKAAKGSGRYKLITSIAMVAVCVESAFDSAMTADYKNRFHHSELQTLVCRKRDEPEFDPESVVPTKLSALLSDGSSSSLTKRRRTSFDAEAIPTTLSAMITLKHVTPEAA